MSVVGAPDRDHASGGTPSASCRWAREAREEVETIDNERA
jgi:hypothetical protein